MKSIQPRKLNAVDPPTGSMEPIGMCDAPNWSRRMNVAVRASTGASMACSSSANLRAAMVSNVLCGRPVRGRLSSFRLECGSTVCGTTASSARPQDAQCPCGPAAPASRIPRNFRKRNAGDGAREQGHQLPARAYPELRVDLLKMALDGAHVEPQTLRDLLVGETARRQLRDAVLL